MDRLFSSEVDLYRVRPWTHYGLVPFNSWIHSARRKRRPTAMSTAGSPLWFVSMAALAAGTLDILFAMAFSHLRAGVTPTRTLHSVAAGLLGRDSFGGGAATAALGLALHFAIVDRMSISSSTDRRGRPIH